MGKYKKLSHVIYKCEYHIVWVPKYRLRILKGAIRDLVEADIKMLCEWKSCEVQELNVQEDHIHLLVSVPPKVSISKLMGTLKGKIAIKLFKSYPKLKKKPYWGNHFWARGYFVSTVGLDEDMIKKYVKYQEKEERRVEDQQQSFDF
ncbi:IS200/IS605 family transposase [Psychroflexus aestuariivivens]|uniref:IS200/IS605 family transposase n=1 Tax=Psychroflexus aestuariivivens TaxID=1795040 RepID=UPI000FD88A30|nr:IS200/IS605 family transposase [Psychroflexus aestuariivivens]